MTYPLTLTRTQAKRLIHGTEIAVRQGTHRGFRVGHEYPVVVKDTTDPVAHIRVSEKIVVEAANIDIHAARRMGYRTSDEWRADWLRSLYPKLVPDPEITDVEAAQIMRAALPDERALIIRYQHVTERRVLVRGGGDGRGYAAPGSRSALPGEPEPVDDQTLDEFARRARERLAAERHREIQSRSVRTETEEIRRLQREAENAGVDLTTELAALRKAREQMQARLRDAA